ncbi:MAG: CBS domain-containing protein [Balneolaceae bacterium]|nr:CBS domain-containing protein [Balneolaceae bacterium]
MLAHELLTTEIEPLHGQDQVDLAIKRMDELQVTGMPVIEPRSEKLVGQISKKELLRVDDPQTTLGRLSLEEPMKVFFRQHVFEAARLMYQYELQIISVVDEEGALVGIITRQNILEELPRMMNLDSNGSILTIELDKIDFTLSEIVHLIEVEGAKILGLTVERPQQEGENFKVSVKINLNDATRITSSLKRHDYHVLVDDASRDVFGFNMENRADELMKYIDM